MLSYRIEFFLLLQGVCGRLQHTSSVYTNIKKITIHLPTGSPFYHLLQKVVPAGLQGGVTPYYLGTPEQILRHHSSLLCPVKILIKTHDGKPVPLRHRILVSIVKIQMKLPGSIGNL